MTSPTTSAPAALLLATDLSHRCDRALDRASITARQWQARLVALTVVEPGSPVVPATSHLPDTAGTGLPDDVAHRAEQRLRADLAADDLALAIRVARGPVTDAILATCDAEAAGLIVTGVARNETLSRIVLGSTVDALARNSPVPLLVVRNRARAPYRDVVVASDFSPSSQWALETAAAFFPEAGFTLFHAFGGPFPALADMDAARARNEAQRLAQDEATAFLQRCELPRPVRDRMRLAPTHGDAAVLLHAHGSTHPDDLVVLGTQRRRGLTGLLLGSVAQRILAQAESDVLLVPPPPAP